MSERKDFNELLADEEFQNGLFHFESLDSAGKKSFINRYSISREDFFKARIIIGGLSFKGAEFSDEQLNYLWKGLGIGKKTLTPKIQSRKIIKWVSRVAAILFIPLLIASIWFYNKSQKLESFTNEKIDRLAGVYNTVFAPAGGKAKAILPDGSEVWLNSGSSIQYPILGKPGYREVKLTGEGFFKVVKNPDKPMLVTTSGMMVKVYGTTFNINAYDDNPIIETVLVEGEISVLTLDKMNNPVDAGNKLKPGEIGVFNRQKNTINISKTDNTEIYTGWIDGKYIFKNKQFKDILKRLEKIHNVEFVIKDNTLGDYFFDATFKDQNIDRIMEIFAVSLPIKWESVKAEQNNDKTFSTRRIIISKDQSRELR